MNAVPAPVSGALHLNSDGGGQSPGVRGSNRQEGGALEAPPNSPAPVRPFGRGLPTLRVHRVPLMGYYGFGFLHGVTAAPHSVLTRRLACPTWRFQRVRVGEDDRARRGQQHRGTQQVGACTPSHWREGRFCTAQRGLAGVGSSGEARARVEPRRRGVLAKRATKESGRKMHKSQLLAFSNALRITVGATAMPNTIHTHMQIIASMKRSVHSALP